MTPSELDSFDKATLIRVILTQAEAIERLTKEVEALRAENAALRTENAALRAKLDLPPKTPGNSSTPPSKGQKASAPKATKNDAEGDTSARKRKSHPGAHRALHPNPTESRDVLACACQHCGADVSSQPQFACEAYDPIDIPPLEPHVIRVTLAGGTCPDCRKTFKASPPVDMPKGSPFGDDLRALIIYLRFVQNIAMERLATLLSTVLGLDISEGAIVNILADARIAFATQRKAIRKRLLSGTILQSDETGLRVGKDNWRLWAFHHEDSALFVASSTRAQSVVADFLGDFRPNYWVSDRYAGQMGWAEKDRQLCLAPLIRDVQYAIDRGDGVIGPDLRHLLGRACRIGARRERLADATLKTYKAKLEARLDDIMARTPTHAAGVKLKEMIKRTRRFLFVFVTNRELPATNNGSERALRPAVIFRKVTNCFRSTWGAELYADIRSVIETGRRRAIDAFTAIRLTLAGKPLAAVLAPAPS